MFHRRIGSIGMRQERPVSRGKIKRMPWQMGSEKRTVQESAPS
jgi:ribosomal protein L3